MDGAFAQVYWIVLKKYVQCESECVPTETLIQFVGRKLSHLFVQQFVSILSFVFEMALSAFLEMVYL